MRWIRPVCARASRRSARPLPVFGLATAVICLAGTASLRAAEEATVWKLWQAHLKADSEQHQRIIDTCDQFTKARPADPLVPLVQGLRTWHLLKLDRTDDARRELEAQLALSGGPMAQGAGIVAKGWLTRLDMQTVHEALQLYYKKEVGYPERLPSLAGHPGIPADRAPPLEDRWGRAWAYRLAGFSSMPGFRNQRYTITSARLGPTSELADALALPYGSQITLRPQRRMGGQGGNASIEFTVADGAAAPFTLGTGRRQEGVFLAFVGRSIIVLCDETHWKVLPAPK